MPGMGRVFGRPREPSNKLSKRNPKRRGGVQKPVSVSRFRGSKVAHRPAARRRTLSVPSVLAGRAAGIAAAPLHVSCFAGRYPLHPGLAIAGFAGWLACWLAGWSHGLPRGISMVAWPHRSRTRGKSCGKQQQPCRTLPREEKRCSEKDTCWERVRRCGEKNACIYVCMGTLRSRIKLGTKGSRFLRNACIRAVLCKECPREITPLKKATFARMT